MASKNMLIVTFVLLTGFGFVGALTKPSSIKLIDNAYTGVVVAIHRDVEEDPRLINVIKVSKSVLLLLLLF